MAFNPDQPRDKDGRFSAVGAYISEDGFSMNATCRGGDIYSDPRIGQLDELIDEQGTVYEGELYRGMDNTFSDYVELEKGIRLDDDTDYTADLEGFEFSDDAFSSTSMDKDIALDFASRGNGYGTLIIIKNNPKSLNVSDVMGEDANWQEERILPRGTTFKTVSARTETIKGKDVLVLEVEAS